MTQEDFSDFLKSTESSNLSIDNLEKLIEKYPYVQSLRIAFLKKLKAENHPDFEKYLSQTATYAYDRNFLRKYINGEDIYALEYVSQEVNEEALETLDLMPLELIGKETLLVENPTLTTENLIDNEEAAIENSELIETETLENPILETENLIDNEAAATENSELIETETIENQILETENLIDNEAAAIENSELIETETLENPTLVTENLIDNEEVVIENSELIETETIENPTLETENLIDNEAAAIENSELIETETIENPILETENKVGVLEKSPLDEIEIEEFKNEISAVDVRSVIEQLPETETLENDNENIDDMQQAMIEKESLENDIQHLITDSKKVEYHAPIEENIDHLIDEDELEGLDDEIEFGFEIDKKIIADDEDISIFDSEPIKHEAGKHHKKEATKAAKKHQKDEVKTAKAKTEDDFELSPDNIFSKDDLRQEGDLFFLDDRPTAEELAAAETLQNSNNTVPSIDFVDKNSDYEDEDAAAFPAEFEEEEAKVESRENVEKIKAILSEADSKAAKKSKIKQYLQRIAQIPLEEEGLISETYADLLAKQGKIERSIRMYQQLILKNPQKKVYFAAKIKQLIKSI